MPLLQRIIKIGNSRAMVLPASWLEFYERKTGAPITQIEIEVNDAMIVRPHLKPEVGK